MGKGKSDSDVIIGGTGALCCVVLICSAFLIGYSFRKLDANEVGLDYSANSLTIDMTQLYEAGVHFLGVGHSFYKFSKAVQEMDLTFYARSSDGLLVELHVKVLYRLLIDKDALTNIQLLMNGDYKVFLPGVAIASIRTVASDFTAFQFWLIRDNITQSMWDQLAIDMADWYGMVDNFLLTNFELPASFQDAITETQNRLQEQSQIKFLQETAETETQTKIFAAAKQVQIIQVTANATATAYQLTIDAQIAKIQALIAAEVNAYRALMTELEFTQEQLVAFVWLDTLAKNQLSTKYFSVSSPESFRV